MISETLRRFRTLAIGVVATAALSASPAIAQTHNHDHDEGAHGGQVAEVGPYDAEIILEDGEIRIFLTSHDAPDVAVPASGGDIVVLADGGSKKITLSPNGDWLVGKPGFEIADEAKAVIRIKTADGKTHAGKAEIETD